MTTVYFAGPDVFLPNYDDICSQIKDICRSSCFRPLLPGDQRLSSSLEIFQYNLNLINQAAGVIANLNPFRGPVEPDSGTVFECAYAFSLRKPVFGVLADKGDLKTRLANAGVNIDYRGLCPGGWEVENFGRPLNLMLFHGLEAICPSLEEAVKTATYFFRKP